MALTEPTSTLWTSAIVRFDSLLYGVALYVPDRVERSRLGICTLILPSSFILRLSKAIPSEDVSTIPDIPLAVKNDASVPEDALPPDAVVVLVNCTLNSGVFCLGAMMAAGRYKHGL